MAVKDKKAWLKLFHEKYGYKPKSKIKKLPGYSGIMDFDEALHIYSETEDPCLIQVVFPLSAS